MPKKIIIACVPQCPGSIAYHFIFLISLIFCYSCYSKSNIKLICRKYKSSLCVKLEIKESLLSFRKYFYGRHFININVGRSMVKFLYYFSFHAFRKIPNEDLEAQKM